MKRISNARIDHIRELFRSVSDVRGRDRLERHLRALCKRVTGVLDPRFLTTEEAVKIILELKNKRRGRLVRYRRAQNILFHSLTRREEMTLRKENPFRKERNDLIRRLRAKGCSYGLLSKVSGLGLTQIYIILKKEVWR
jgi:hypothetical protein